MKKLFPEKKLTKKKFAEFLDKKGFYVVLVLCIAIIGATAIFVTRYNIPSSNKDFDTEGIIPDDFYNEFALEDEGDFLLEESIDTPANTSEQNDINETEEAQGDKTDIDETVLTDDKGKEIGASEDKGNEPLPQVETVAENSASKSDTAVTVSTNADMAKAQTNSDSQSIEASNEASQNFIMPVLGEVICVFAQDRLLYSKTLDQWRAHSGIDLAADRGTPVKAVANGVVVDVKNDPRWGITVVIEHNNGLKTVYSNLASDDMVVQNEKVAQGDIIGCVGNTAAFESAEQPHLHFEVWKDGEPVNPEDYLYK